MKHWLASAALICFCANANADWQGKLDLSPNVNPVFIREFHDNNNLAGYGKPNLFHLDYLGTEILHAGIFHAWREGRGDASLGISAGANIPAAPALGAILDLLEMPQTAKFIENVSSSLALDGYGGYRPVHGPDVHAWIYGAGLVLQKKFGLPDLKAGQ